GELLAEDAQRLLRARRRAAAGRPPVDQAVGVEQQRGAGREGAGLLLVDQVGVHALVAHPERLADLLYVELDALAVAQQQRRGVAGVGERELPRPGVVDEVL